MKYKLIIFDFDGTSADSLFAYSPEMVFSDIDEIPEKLAGRLHAGKPEYRNALLDGTDTANPS